MTHLDVQEDVVVTKRSEEAPEKESVTAVEEVRHYHYPDDGTTYTFPVRKIDQTVWLIAAVIEVLIGLRVFLKLIAANPQSGFANFIYNITAPFLAPFAGLTATPSANGSVLEISSIIAMVVYALLFWLIIYVIHLILDR